MPRRPLASFDGVVLGKLRHLNVQYLWLQERADSGDIVVAKVAGQDNASDLLTKHLAAHDMQRHFAALDVTLDVSRAASAPSLGRLGAGDGDCGRWCAKESTIVVHHERPRRQLVTPLRAQGVPPARTWSSCRITKGRYIDNGQPFEHPDNWRNSRCANMVFDRAWAGSTYFLINT